MPSVPEVAQAMGQVLGAGAEQAATATGLVQRRAKLTGRVFTQALVFGWLADPDASLCSLTRMAATLGVPISLLAAKALPEVSAQRQRFASGEKDQARQKRRPLSKAWLARCDWTIYVTNAPAALLSREEALILARARGQI